MLPYLFFFWKSSEQNNFLCQGQAETPTAEPVEVPELAPSPSLPNFEQVPQNAAQRQEIQSSPVPSEPEEMGACALPPRSLLPPTLVNRKVKFKQSSSHGSRRGVGHLT